VQEWSILLPSAAIPWVEESSFTAKQRRQHDKAHALWKFTTVVIHPRLAMRVVGYVQQEIRREEEVSSTLDRAWDSLTVSSVPRLPRRQTDT
jgi:hypothetical protein